MCVLCLYVFFFKQKTAYEMRISDWSSDVCSSDLLDRRDFRQRLVTARTGKQRHVVTGGLVAKRATQVVDADTTRSRQLFLCQIVPRGDDLDARQFDRPVRALVNDDDAAHCERRREAPAGRGSSGSSGMRAKRSGREQSSRS